MNNLWSIYLQLGFEHILDLNAYDHILFVVVLCTPYLIKDWRKLILLATAFTLGHSLTLALSVGNIVQFPSNWIEFLIPITILLTGLYNLKDSRIDNRMAAKYLMAAIFGLIHGMGFSNYLKSLMMPGEESSFWQQLLAFNIGVELGQIVIILMLLVLQYILINIFKLPFKTWIWTISIVVIIKSLHLTYLTWPV